VGLSGKQRQGARARHGSNVLERPLADGRASNAKAVAFLASWRWTTVPEHELRSCREGSLRPCASAWLMQWQCFAGNSFCHWLSLRTSFVFSRPTGSSRAERDFEDGDSPQKRGQSPAKPLNRSSVQSARDPSLLRSFALLMQLAFLRRALLGRQLQLSTKGTKDTKKSQGHAGALRREAWIGVRLSIIRPGRETTPGRQVAPRLQRCGKPIGRGTRKQRKGRGVLGVLALDDCP